MSGRRRTPDLAPSPGLGRAAAELLRDLAGELQVLEGWALLARVELKRGRTPLGEVERIARLTGELGGMLRDVAAAAGGKGAAGGFDPVAATEAEVRERVREMGPLRVRLESEVEAGVWVAGREALWSWLVGRLVSEAARRARAEVRVRLHAEAADGARVVVLRVEDDGAATEEGEEGAGAAAWLAERLGGEVRWSACAVPPGTRAEVRVPAEEPRAEGAAGEENPIWLDGVRFLVVEGDAAERTAVAERLRRAQAEVAELDPEGESPARVVEEAEALRPEVVLLGMAPGGAGPGLWEWMRTRAPGLAARVVFVAGPEGTGVEGRGRPWLRRPVEPGGVVEALRRLGAGQG